MNTHWDAAAEEMRWRELADKSRAVQERLRQKLLTLQQRCLQDQFSHLALAEADAAMNFGLPQCCSSRAAFVAELKRLISEPTNPSIPVESIEGYEEGQKMWLVWLLGCYEKDSLTGEKAD